MKWCNSATSSSIEPGDHIRLSGGYDMEPAWLNGLEVYDAVALRFIPGQNEAPALVVRTDHPVTFEGVTGYLLILELRFAGATWSSPCTVHLELCDFDPPDVTWKDRRQGVWIESHATCTLLTGTSR